MLMLQGDGRNKYYLGLILEDGGKIGGEVGCCYPLETSRSLGFPLRCHREIFCWEGGEVLAQLPREAEDAPSNPGGVQGQVGWGPGQPGLVLNVEVGSPD